MLNPQSTQDQHIRARYDALLRALRESDFRLTPQRMAICRYLAETRSHPTPNDIFHAIKAQYPTISRATVYNTVAVLKDLGQIVELPSSSGASVRYETDLTPHVNLNCSRCGRIFDLPMERLDDVFKMIDSLTDFQLHNIHIEGYGICPVCQQELAQEEKAEDSRG